MLTHQQALIYCMVVMSAADAEISNREVDAISHIIVRLPAFQDYDVSGLSETMSECLEFLSDENGIEIILDRVYIALPPVLRETAYALAIEVAAADLHTAEEEINLLQLLRQKLELDRLICAGIERGARARFASL